MSKDGNYWNVNSAGIFRKKYSRRKRKVESLPTIGNSLSTETVEVNRGHSYGATATSENSSLTSDIKDIEKSRNSNELGEKSDVSSVQVDIEGFEGYSREEDSNKTYKSDEADSFYNVTDKVETEVVDNGNKLVNLQREGENDGISERISQSDDATQDDKACGLRQYLQSLTPQERAQIAEREARLAKERVAEPARLYPDRK